MAKAIEYPGGVPPEWRATVRRVPRGDGRWLVYYAFEPSPGVPEVVLGS